MKDSHCINWIIALYIDVYCNAKEDCSKADNISRSFSGNLRYDPRSVRADLRPLLSHLLLTNVYTLKAVLQNDLIMSTNKP